MADLSTAVEYDRVYPVNCKTPDGSESGLVVNVVSKDSKRVVKALRDAQSAYWAALASAKPEDAANVMPPDVERVVLINCIDSWDWGEHSFAHISGSGPASLEDREFVIDHPNTKWIRDSIVEGCANIENFSQPLPKSARSGSKKT